MTTPSSTRQEVTQLLGEWSGGDDGALEKLVPAGATRIAPARPSLHEPGARLGTPCKPPPFLTKLTCGWSMIRSRSGKAGPTLSRRPRRLMRRIMVDHARERHSLKRGGGALKVTLDEAALVTETRSQELLALDEALERLAAQDARKSQIVELRYFGGLTVEETAEFLKLSQRTVEREWTMAKAWLYRALSEEET